MCNEELWDEKNIIEKSEFIFDLNQIFENDKSKNMISVGQITKLHEYLGEEIELYLKNEKERQRNFLCEIYSDEKKYFFNKIKFIWKKEKEEIRENNYDLNEIDDSYNKENSESDFEEIECGCEEMGCC